MFIRYPLSNSSTESKSRPPVFALVALQDRDTPLSYSEYREDLKQFAAFFLGSMKTDEGELFLDVASELCQEMRGLRNLGKSSFEAYEIVAHPLAEKFMEKYEEV